MAGCSACSTGIAGILADARAGEVHRGQRDRGGGERGRRQPARGARPHERRADDRERQPDQQRGARQHLRAGGRRERPRHPQRLAEPGGGRARRDGDDRQRHRGRERGGQQSRAAGGRRASPHQVVQPPAREQRDAERHDHAEPGVVRLAEAGQVVGDPEQGLHARRHEQGDERGARDRDPLAPSAQQPDARQQQRQRADVPGAGVDERLGDHRGRAAPVLGQREPEHVLERDRDRPALLPGGEVGRVAQEVGERQQRDGGEHDARAESERQAPDRPWCAATGARERQQREQRRDGQHVEARLGVAAEELQRDDECQRRDRGTAGPGGRVPLRVFAQRAKPAPADDAVGEEHQPGQPGPHGVQRPRQPGHEPQSEPEREAGQERARPAHPERPPEPERPERGDEHLQAPPPRRARTRTAGSGSAT